MTGEILPLASQQYFAFRGSVNKQIDNLREMISDLAGASIVWLPSPAVGATAVQTSTNKSELSAIDPEGCVKATQVPEGYGSGGSRLW